MATKMCSMFKIDVPWLLAKLGVRKWLVERVFHIPENRIVGWCKLINAATGLQITPVQWRAIEARMADLLYTGLVMEDERL